ncbi:PqqD family protein [Paenibacillus sp. FSL H7-0350]|uniref:PqqD family protein n=1 Tax=Paenibacillus sp. FSL H7-0350 TaxID=2975345 RepID=UPI0031587F37
MLYKLNARDFGWNQIDEDFVVFTMTDEKYHVFNETAKELFEFIHVHEGCSIDDINNYFEQNYEIENQEQLSQDIKIILEQMQQIGMLYEIS